MRLFFWIAVLSLFAENIYAQDLQLTQLNCSIPYGMRKYFVAEDTVFGAGGGVFLSKDGGVHFRERSINPHIVLQAERDVRGYWWLMIEDGWLPSGWALLHSKSLNGPFDTIPGSFNEEFKLHSSGRFCFANSSKGMLFTSDYGKTWNPTRKKSSNPLIACFYGTPVTIAYIDYFDGQDSIFYSTDEGATWNARVLPRIIGVVRSMIADSVGTIYIGTNTGKVLRTKNNGRDWEPILNTVTWVSLGFYSDKIKLAGHVDPVTGKFDRMYGIYTHDHWHFLASEDGGNTWSLTTVDSLADVHLYDLAATSKGVILGTDVAHWVTNDNGDHWLNDTTSSPILSSNSMLRLAKNTLLASGYERQRTTDGGNTWRGGISSTKLLHHSSGAIYTTNYQGLYRSTDGGVTDELCSPDKIQGANIIADHDTLYYQSGGQFQLYTLYRSIDNAKSWTLLHQDSLAFSVGVSSEDHSVLIVYPNGKALRKVGGSTEWISASLPLNSKMPFMSGDRLFLRGKGLSSYEYQNGSWQLLTIDTAAEGSVQRILTLTTGELYAATSVGLYYSRSGNGSDWQVIGGEIAGRSILDIVADTLGDFYISVDGAGIYHGTHPPLNRIVSRIVMENSHLTITPNPSISYTKLLLHQPEEVSEIRVIDMMGREIVRYAADGRQSITISSLPSMSYYCQVLLKNGRREVYPFVRQ